MCSFESRLGEENAVICDNANRVTMDVRKSLVTWSITVCTTRDQTYGDNGWAIFFLELTETTTIDYSGDNVPHVKCLPEVGTNNAVEFMRRIDRILWRNWWLRLIEMSWNHVKLLVDVLELRVRQPCQGR